jgi:3-methyladenine DNA glycosylase/8-oxoguanine DNA glycosylase
MSRDWASAPNHLDLAVTHDLCRGQLNDESFAHMTDEQVEVALTEIPGIGPWTAHAFLIVGLDRPGARGTWSP